MASHIESLLRLDELTRQGVVNRQAGDLTAAAESVRACHDLLDGFDGDTVFDLGPDLVPMRAEWALTSTLQGDEELALRGWERCWEQAGRFGLDELRRESAAAVAVVHAFNGDCRYATHWLDRTDPDTPSSATPLAAVARATLALDALELPDAERELAEAQALVTSERWADLAFVEARLASLDGKHVSGMARLRATCLAHYPKQWSGGANWELIDSATRILDRVDARVPRGDRGGYGGSSVTEYADVVIALRALDDGKVESARMIALDDLDQPTVSLRTGAGMRLLLAVTAPDEQAALAPAEAALETIRTEHLYYLLRYFPQPSIRTLAARNDELVPYLGDPDATPQRPTLTKREREVLWYIAQGYRFEQIAAAEYISVNTVKSHAKNLYQRIGVNDRSSAARYGEANPDETLAPSDDY
ncbi:LuxR C-terminal-related transcriptional regulator [Herbiconiux sp. CPCC 205716]|uniref:LuxR C-terminal-related transcriptional regulator n=1 Tax=Herbiconiux gentiana TaxID=2970912 RepID=A0ABT2GBA6_9MICO|nr:LuxR C-terminal-related transcriptional regulator [Herbiconiux gentiana]MCS5713478.1 LuxR C-terminal-related transcriptional regulator [Herbiconiux gentiana]